jgi:hypothetical protein
MRDGLHGNFSCAGGSGEGNTSQLPRVLAKVEAIVAKKRVVISADPTGALA